jgi:hypothetical protein
VKNCRQLSIFARVQVDAANWGTYLPFNLTLLTGTFAATRCYAKDAISANNR